VPGKRPRADLTTRAWKTQAARIKKRDGYRCTACGSESDLTVDHIDAVANTGRTEYHDHELTTLCRPCNSRKGAHTNHRPAYRNPRWS
jgi:5-methylcytosine-specific restriction endonuclease McrA